jgi:CheY-like chemotaxis protein
LVASPGGVLVVHDEEAIVDLLRGFFEAQGYTVATSSTFDDAIACVNRADAVVLAAWDRTLGQQLFRWVADGRRDLRHRFVFVVDELTEATAEGAARGRIVPLHDLGALLDAVANRLARLRQRPARPRVLLAEDDPDQRAAICDLLAGEGFEVDAVAGGHAAIARLERGTFDAVLSDWTMPEGSGIELYAWLASRRPELLSALVFLTGGDVTSIRTEVAPVPVLPKGQDSPQLLGLLRQPRAIAAGTPTHGYTVEAVLPTGLIPRRAQLGDDDEATLVDDIVQDEPIRGTTFG